MSSIITTESSFIESDYFLKVNKYFDRCENELGKKLSQNKNYKYIFSKDNNDEYIVEIYNNNKLILKSHYEVAGVYNVQNSVWYWGWNMDLIDRKLTVLSKHMKKFSAYIKENQSQFGFALADELYFKTKHGNFYTSTEKILPLIKVMMFLTKTLWYISICHGKDNTLCSTNDIKNDIDKTITRLEYIVIKDILQIR